MSTPVYSPNAEGSISDPGKSRIAYKYVYPDAYTDFHGLPSGAKCLFKTGPAWPKPPGFSRELRPVRYGDVPIADSSHQIGEKIIELFESRKIRLNTVDYVGIGNVGDAKPFCPLLVWIGVQPDTLDFEDAKSAAEYVKDTILVEVGISGVEVAIRECIVWP